MFENFENEILIIARLLLGGAFVFAGLNRKLVASLMAARGVPQAALALWLGIVLQVAAGALVIAGIWTAPAAAALILFLIVATPMFHNFWDHQGADRAVRINGVVSNAALGGGFLALIAHSL
ncbi:MULTISPECIES: DoxX family protein [unclassified Mesorhizobium]|uniref:DoxX family protein n=1 Tax=unclassified Mesorhizobium TaxID=325217 RepID=UPI000F75C5C8|nr:MULTISPECIES: DoxX family protein [unclassified Mesorhizobium]AZO02395.1 DoxX family protein [Mesorhizobium sp. M2A.F.Ca.ET.043.02.1.1]RUW41146.1 DoxX family protein [Mesorhizobium sp. M2A.F.Ca.ET.015.02.1.1]RUW73948.1 DoxX family protein [Mesorhizobium sp. M2A.F.Ca.ET.067.02.1.1]RVC91066.1 DoxX family protein [Mesorhizobium sp. M2A.F.Ca.ET.017.03.2.1]RVD05767.1 DoxX family protein [Mesorhizobium sp. M2A.F.Ca.ET.029.05.1.1]